MIGNAADAKLISECGGYATPKGWRRLGSGCYRTAYLSPEGVVYKVETYRANGCNKREADNLIRLNKKCRMPEGTRLPKFTYYSDCGVIAMERLDRTLHEVDDHEDWNKYQSLRAQIGYATRICDMHNGNVMVDDETGDLVPVDLGEYGGDTNSEDYADL